jgi:hypothetical protein
MKKMACASCGGAMKKMQKGGVSEIVGMPKYSNNPRSEQGRVLKSGGTINRSVSPGCRGGQVKDASGKCVNERKFKTGGAIKKMQNGGTNSVVIRKAKSTDPYTMTLEGLEMKKKGLEMKHNGMQMKLKGEAMKKMPEKIVQTNKMAKGGATTNKKFAALAPPYNKATFADRIAGAKKRTGKK